MGREEEAMSAMDGWMDGMAGPNSLSANSAIVLQQQLRVQLHDVIHSA